MSGKKGSKYEDDMELRRGPWTLEEDTLLIHYIACHGEGRWNQLARCSGLKRTGKSCRLRWLNYLKPDVKRGNLTPEEQILILELHSRWGNRWSRIAQHLPGRTDNEIKNYWRTRVQKQARQLKIDANSTVFRDAVRCFWMPRLMEKLGADSPPSVENLNPNYADPLGHGPQGEGLLPSPDGLLSAGSQSTAFGNTKTYYELSAASEICSPCISSDTMAVAQLADVPEFSQTPSSELSNLLLQQYNALFSHHAAGNDHAHLEAAGAAAMVPASSGAAIGSSASGYSMMASCCGDNSFDSMWGTDELWQVRKVQDWGGNLGLF